MTGNRVLQSSIQAVFCRVRRIDCSSDVGNHHDALRLVAGGAGTIVAGEGNFNQHFPAGRLKRFQLIEGVRRTMENLSARIRKRFIQKPGSHDEEGGRCQGPGVRGRRREARSQMSDGRCWMKQSLAGQTQTLEKRGERGVLNHLRGLRVLRVSRPWGIEFPAFLGF